MMRYLFLLVNIFLLSSTGLISTVSSSDQSTESGTASIEKKGTESPSSPFTALLGDTLYRWKYNADDTMEVEELSTADLLKGKTAVAIYFSASWCGPCKQFTPVLAKLYKDLNKKGKKLEVVWLSRDRSSDEFLGYYQQMPWLAVTLQNLQPILEKLAPKYQLKVWVKTRVRLRLGLGLVLKIHPIERITCSPNLNSYSNPNPRSEPI
jgi:thiol-disulfide isomerase/thioredoxin